MDKIMGMQVNELNDNDHVTIETQHRTSSNDIHINVYSRLSYTN